MMTKKICVFYWTPHLQDEIGIKHNTVIDYSKEKRDEIIEKVLDNNYQVMLSKPHKEDILVIQIDNRRFRQR